MTRYASGASAERELKKALELAYPGSFVGRMAGSHGPADLVWVNSIGECTFIQVKASKKDAASMLSGAMREVDSIHCANVQKLVALRSRGKWSFYTSNGMKRTILSERINARAK